MGIVIMARCHSKSTRRQPQELYFERQFLRGLEHRYFDELHFLKFGPGAFFPLSFFSFFSTMTNELSLSSQKQTQLFRTPTQTKCEVSSVRKKRMEAKSLQGGDNGTCEDGVIYSQPDRPPGEGHEQ